MTFNQPVNPSDIEMHVTPGCGDAAVYQNGVLVTSGHLDDVYERLVEALGIEMVYESNPYVVADERGRMSPAPTLEALAEGQERIAAEKSA